MNIILGESAVKQLGDKYVVLELDTVTINNSDPIKAYCVVDAIPLIEFPKVENLVTMHTTLIEQYRKRNWEFCEQALDHLYGSWNCQLDSFYADLKSRVAQYKENEPDNTWTGIVAK